MKLQKYHIVRGFPYNGDMPPEVENYISAFIGMAYDVQEVDREIERLESENAKLRALVKRGASFGFDRCSCGGGFESCFSCACKEALK